MKFRISALTMGIALGGLAWTGYAVAANSSDARSALAKQDGDADQSKQLEEVFQAAEKSYSLLKSGDTRLTYSFNYSNTRDARIDFANATGTNGTEVVTNFVRNTTDHTFTNTFSFDYGIWDNLTFSVRIPLVAKYSENKSVAAGSYISKEKTVYGVGDIGLSLRWQPFEVRPGRPSLTLNSSFNLKTGESPYEINPDKDLSTGSGYFSLGFGASLSHVLDPVVLFGSVGYNINFEETGLNQYQGDPTNRNLNPNQDTLTLSSVNPGDSYSMNMGFAYSLSYDVSMSASYQMSYSRESVFTFKDGRSVDAPSSTSGIINMSLGLRMSPTYIVNINAGFGLTEDSPDILLGFSLPLDLEGLKAE